MIALPKQMYLYSETNRFAVRGNFKIYGTVWINRKLFNRWSK